MRIWKQLACLALSGAMCLGLLAGCAGEGDGVSLSVCVGAAPVSLDPIYAEETGDQTILAHLYENLMRVTVDVSGNPTVTGGMAKTVDQEESYDGTVTYTFRLRSAKWSDGSNVKAGDFVYAWQRLADPAGPPTRRCCPLWRGTTRPAPPGTCPCCRSPPKTTTHWWWSSAAATTGF